MRRCSRLPTKGRSEASRMAREQQNGVGTGLANPYASAQEAGTIPLVPRKGADA